MKKMDVFLAQSDLYDLLIFLELNNAELYDGNGIKIQEKDIQGKNLSDSFYAFPLSMNPKSIISRYELSEHYSNGDCVYIFLNGISDYGLHIPGAISCCEQDDKAIVLYKLINRYVKANYHKAYNSTYYIAPQMYKEWLSGKISFHFFVDVHFFTVPNALSSVDKIIEKINQLGYNVLMDQRDIRNQSSRDRAYSYIVFPEGAKLSAKIISKVFRYFPDSEAAFLIKPGKRGNWKIVMDNRFYMTTPGMKMFQALQSNLVSVPMANNQYT